MRARRSGIWSRKPVAITVILTSSPIFSSSTAPKMMLASSCAELWISDEASLTSESLSLLEPVMLIRMPRAPSIAPASSSGEAIAACAASIGAVLAGADRRAHHRVAHARHGGLHVGKVAVDDAGNGDDVGDALHALPQHVVGDAEALEEAGVLGHRQQLLVGDHDHRVDAVDQLLQAALGLLQAALAFKRRTACVMTATVRMPISLASDAITGAAPVPVPPPRPGGDEDHVGAFEGLDDLLRILERGAAAHVGIGARAEPGWSAARRAAA